MKKTIEVEALPLDNNGNPILGEVLITAGDVATIGENGVEKVKGSRVSAKMSKSLIRIESSLMGKVFDLYEGTKMSISVFDAPNGQLCPDLVTLGEVVLVKGASFELTYSDDIIDESWTRVDRVIRDGLLQGKKSKLYPEYLKTQKELMNTLLRHESVVACPFVRFKLEHPPEIQKDLDLEVLIQQEKALKERKTKAEEEFKKQEDKLIEKRKTFEKNIK